MLVPPNPVNHQKTYEVTHEGARLNWTVRSSYGAIVLWIRCFPPPGIQSSFYDKGAVEYHCARPLPYGTACESCSILDGSPCWCSVSSLDAKPWLHVFNSFKRLDNEQVWHYLSARLFALEEEYFLAHSNASGATIPACAD